LERDYRSLVASVRRRASPIVTGRIATLSHAKWPRGTTVGLPTLLFDPAASQIACWLRLQPPMSAA